MKYSKTALPLALQLLSCRAIQPRPTLSLGFINFHNTPSFSTKRFSTDEKTSEESSSSEVEVDPIKFESPWSRRIPKNSQRFRQHINPLARKYQMQTEIKEEWPNDGTFTDPSLPLYIDIGCSKGGFLLDLAEERQKNPNASEGERNYLGLEIRPSVAQFAKGRVERRGLSGKLDFIGCNANVDLGRILTKYGSFGDIDMVSIQYPDPHFKVSTHFWTLKKNKAEIAWQTLVMTPPTFYELLICIGQNIVMVILSLSAMTSTRCHTPLPSMIV